jgi:cathepsin L
MIVNSFTGVDLDSQALSLASRWGAWKTRFAQHDSADEVASFAKFAAADRVIAAHNVKGLSWSLGHNRFSDLDDDEFQAMYLMHDLHEARPITAVVNATDLPAPPASVNWVAKGVFPAVKSQGSCPSCWAFASVAAIESAFVIAGNNLTSLSEQELVSCYKRSCSEGNPNSAFVWIKANGLPTEEAYPYASHSGNSPPCVSKTPFVTLTGYTSVARHDELALVAAAAQTPLTVDIDAKDSSFRFYKGGILDTPNCGTAYNHVVVVAGYATDGGVDYYNVRNRWVSAVAAQHLRMAEDNCLSAAACNICLH